MKSPTMARMATFRVRDLEFVPAARQAKGQQTWEAVKRTGASSRHEFQAWTHDGATWSVQLQVRWSSGFGPTFLVTDCGSVSEGVDRTREAYRHLAAQRFG